MFRLSIASTLLCFALPALGDESKSQAAKELVAKLSWDSIDGDCMGGFLVHRLNEGLAKQFVELGTDADEALVAVLDDPKRGVAAHFALLLIHDAKEHGRPGAWQFMSVNYNWRGKELDGWTYTHAGLSWSWSEGTSDVVTKEELQANKKRWIARLKLK